MRIYLDICALCRPFDDQTQPRIWLETQALSIVLNLVETGRVEMVRSAIHDFETAQNPWELRRLWVGKCLDLTSIHIPLSASIRQLALAHESAGLKPMDALHAASAQVGSCTHLLTCDDRFSKHRAGSLRILNPADFIVEHFKQNP